MRANSASQSLVGEADRAGTVVREQISAMIEAARGAADEIDRAAVASSDAERQSAREGAGRVLATIRSVESELSTLRQQVGLESDGLRAKLDRARLRSSAGSTSPASPTLPAAAKQSRPELAGAGPAGVSGADLFPPQPESRSEEAPPEVQEPKAAEPKAAEPEVEEPKAAEPEVEEPKAAEPEVEEPESAEPEVEAKAAGPAEAEPGPDADEDELTASPGTTSDLGDLDEEARSRVAAKSDLELAELHKIATTRSSKGGPDEATYWNALVSATVHEAASRPDFGERPPGEEPGGRRAKKKRASALRPLAAAREAAIQARDQGGAEEAR